MQRLNDLPLSCKLQHVRTTPISTRHERHPVVRHASRARTGTGRLGVHLVRAAELLTRSARALASALVSDLRRRRPCRRRRRRRRRRRSSGGGGGGGGVGSGGGISLPDL